MRDLKRFSIFVLSSVCVLGVAAVGGAQSVADQKDQSPESKAQQSEQSDAPEASRAAPGESPDEDQSSSDSGTIERLERRIRRLEQRVEQQEAEEDSAEEEEGGEPSEESIKSKQDAEETSLDEELDQLEQEVTGEQAEQTEGSEKSEGEGGSGSVGGAIQSMNPEISFILDASGGWASGESDLRGGHDPTPPGFSLQGLELAAGVDVDPFFRFDAAILFSLFGVEIEEAYATSLNLPAQLQLRAGQFKTRFGRLNPTHLHTWKFATQPLANAKFFGGESLRGMGVELSQLVLPIPGTFSWYVALQNVAGGATGRSFIPASSDLDTFGDLTVSARIEEFVALSPSWSLLVGLNYANGRNKTGRNNRTELYGADLYLDWKNVTKGGRSRVGWQTEFMSRRRQVSGDVLEDYGGYSEVFWQPGRYWETGLRYEYVSGIGPQNDQPSLFGGTVQAVDPLDPNWTEARQRGAYQVTYYPSHFTKLRLQYSLDHMPYREGSEMDELVHMVFLQAEFVSGSHGAHSY